MRIKEALFFGTHFADIEAVTQQLDSLSGTDLGHAFDDPNHIFTLTIDFRVLSSSPSLRSPQVSQWLTTLGTQTLSIGLRKGLELRLKGPNPSTDLLVFSLWSLVP